MTRASGRRDTTALAAASLLSGVLAYVVFAVATRALGPGGAAPVSVLWTWWSLSAAAITFPLQHWLTRTVTAYGGFRAARPALLPLVVIVGAASAAAGGAAWLLRESLFHRDGAGFPLLVAALTVGSAVMGVVRGGLGAREQFGALAVTMLAENGARCAGVLALWAAGVDDPVAYGSVIAAAHLAGLCWPAALTFPATGRSLEGGRRSALALLSGASSGQLLAQVVLTGGPVVLALLGGLPAEVTALFVGLAVYRAPYIVAMGVVPQLTGRVTVLVVEGKVRELARFRQLLAAATALLALGAVGVGLWVGPPLVRWVFGSEVDLPASTSALLAVGSVFAVANLVGSILVIAHDRPRASAVSWLSGLACATVVLVTGLDALDRIAVAFLIAEAVAFGVLLVSARRPAAGPSSP